jgi:hypothetical protein
VRKVSETAEHQARSGSRRWVVVGALAVVGLILVLAYVRVGWWRMESACTTDPAGGIDEASVSYGWAWSPAGFHLYLWGRTCPDVSLV